MVEFKNYKGIGKDSEDVIFTMASGPVIVKEDKVLLDKHGEDDFWKFPGGKQSDNESCRENAIREVKEELNIEIKLVEKEPCVLIFEREKEGKKEYVVLVHYLAEISEGKPSKGRDVREFKWFDIKALPEDAAPNIKPVLERFGY